MEKVNKRIKELKSKFKFSKVKQVWKNPKVISYLNILQEQFVVWPIDKTANNIAFMCKKCHVQVLLKELGLLNITSNTYQQVNDTLHNAIQHKIATLNSAFGLKIVMRNLIVFHVFISYQKCIKYPLVQDL